jgi:hypothetical protein
LSAAERLPADRQARVNRVYNFFLLILITP